MKSNVALLALALLALVPGVPRARALLKPVVVVGDVTDRSARLHVETTTRSPVSIVVDPGSPARRVAVSATPDPDLVARLQLHNLAPGRRHDYRVITDLGTVDGHFVTAPAVGDAALVRLLWSGDLGAGKYCDDRAYPIFDAMSARGPDLFLFVGDTVYADDACPGLPGAGTPAATFPEFRIRYRHNLSGPAVQSLLRRTSVTAIWDDHEVRGNFSGQTEPLMPVGRAAFIASWPMAAPPEEPTRLYRRLRWGALLEIFVLDTRQYRSPNWRPDGRSKTMLGAAQRAWLVDAVTTSNARWKIVVSTVPLSLPKGLFISDSWAPRAILGYRTGFARERDAILEAFRAAGVANLVVLAADAHFATAIEHAPAPNFHFWELVSGPLAARTKDPWPPAAGLASRVLFARGDAASFGELDVRARELIVRYYAGDGRRLWEGTLRARDERRTQ